MIVFYYLISFILIAILSLIVVLMFSSIVLEIKELKIDDVHKGTAIISDVIEKQYEQIIDNIEILLKLKIKIFNIIPVNIITINNKKIKSMIEKNKGKIQVTPKNKELGKVIFSDLINNHLEINKININISLGLHNAHCTALISTLLMIVIAIVLNAITEDRIKIYKNERKQENYINNNFRYKVRPIYSDDIVFKLGISFKFTIKIISLIKEILMYKSNLFVNNTNKYKVKES